MAELLRSTWPRHAAKKAARASGGPIATAKRWVTARVTPSADTLLRMAAENQELRAELIRRLEGYGYADAKMAPNTGVDAPSLRSDLREDSRPAGPATADEADAVRVMNQRAEHRAVKA